MNDKLNISIRIADQPRILLSIPRDEEELVRNAEAAINKLWRSWSSKFSDKTPGEVLAMVTFRFAHMYFAADAQAQEVASVLADYEHELDRLLLE